MAPISARAAAGPAPLAKHAVVIGGSISGLLAARVLSRYAQRVTVIERDVIPETPDPRKGVPQGAHVHVIFGGGVRAIERLFPGFFEELTAAGSVVCDFAKDLAWYHAGVWKLRVDSDLTSYWQSRPFLEGHIRRRVRSDTGVRFLDADVVGLIASADHTRINGVEIEHRGVDEKQVETIEADLVVDAAGRGSRTPQWLEVFGYAKPDETIVEINIGYASRIVELAPDLAHTWKILATYATPPAYTRTGYLFPIEGNRWLATAVGFLQDYPPADDEGFLKYAQAMETPDFYQAIKDARPLTPIRTFKFPCHRWRRYDRQPRLPAGLLILGDAMCSFNPVYGQGMSTCAREADLLDQMLGQCNGAIPADFGLRFARRTAKIVADPWLLATLSDFLYPQTVGRRPFGTRLLSWYVIRVLKSSEFSRAALLRFYRVMHMLARPTALFHPSVVLAVCQWICGRRGGSR